MNKTIGFWILFLLGIIWIIISSFFYLSEIQKYCYLTINFNNLFKIVGGETERFSFDLLFILLSLLGTMFLFFFTGKYFSEKKIKSIPNSKEIVGLQNEIEKYKAKIDEMKLLYTGGKIEKKSNSHIILSHENSILTEENLETITTSSQEKLTTLLQTKTTDVSPTYSEEYETLFGNKLNIDDFKIIEGIGPKLELILKNNHITSWKQLAAASPAQIKEILWAHGGAAYKIHDPSSWPKQAELALHGHWEKLKEIQDLLKGNK